LDPFWNEGFEEEVRERGAHGCAERAFVPRRGRGGGIFLPGRSAAETGGCDDQEGDLVGQLIFFMIDMGRCYLDQIFNNVDCDGGVRFGFRVHVCKPFVDDAHGLHPDKRVTGLIYNFSGKYTEARP
jgi:hypothetical protein